jgi:hypothetical protein
MGPVSRNELQKLLPVVFALHPHRNVAECVLLDLCDTVDCLSHTQEQRDSKRDRRKTEGFHKLAFTRWGLLQAAAYLASEAWERDQESAVPARHPVYHSTAEDLLVRYIKTLDWWAMERRVPYAVTAMGCSLYTYTPQEMGQLVYWAAPNIRRFHRKALARLQDRFPHLPLATASQHKQVDLRAPTPDERALVAQALACFAPWTSHLARQPDGSLWESHFAAIAASESQEREQVHAILDPQCAGFHRLIDDYNSFLGVTSTMRLAPPDTKLGVPIHTSASSSGTSPHVADRFQPPTLSEDDLARLEYTLARRRERRQRMRPVWLSVYVDGREILRCPAQDLTSHVMLVPAHGSYLQIYGHDADGPLLLAVFPLPEGAHALAAVEQSLVVRPAVGQTITLTLQPLQTATGDLEQYRLQLTYDVAQAQARAPLHDPFIRWLSALWHPPLAGALVTAADIPPQEKTFYLDEGTIRVTCTWWTATRDRPAALWMQWHADVTRPGDLWVRFTHAAPEEAAVILAELRLGSALAGEAEWSTDTLGFDPSRERWALALMLREPAS